MTKILSIIKNEFYRFFTTPIAAVYLIAFLMLNGSFAIYFGHFFERGQAELSTMFAYQPWLYLLLLPGISMRLWSEEFKSKTIIQILTLPIPLSSLVWGKFLASWLFSLLALFLTFPFWITVNILGSPDNGIILFSYIGSLILAGAMLSISQTMSAISKSPIIALVTAVIVNLIFFLSGLEFVLSFFREIMPDSIVNMIASFSFLNHFTQITQGIIKLSDITYFILLIILFNTTTQLVINFKTNGSTPWLQSNSWTAHLIAFISLFGIFAGTILITDSKLSNIQYDATKEKLYTLSSSTKDIVKKISSPVIAKLFYSPILEQKNPNFREAYTQSLQLLKTIANVSPDKFQVQLLHPSSLNEAEDLAISYGLQPITLVDNNENAFFGIVFTDEIDNTQTIPFIALEKQNRLELEIVKSLYKLNLKKPKLGIITSLSLFAEELNGVATSEWKLVEKLKSLYNIKKITSASEIEEQELLLIIHPQDLSTEMQKAIKDFSYAGKGVALFLDSAAESPQLYAPAINKPQPSKDTFFENIWGFQFSQNAVIADLEKSTYVNTGKNNKTHISQDIIQFYINGQGLNKQNPITSHLQQLLIISGGALRPKNQTDISFIPLLQSTKNSVLMSANVARDAMHPDRIITYFKPDNTPKTFAAYIESKNAKKPFRIVVAGDTDFIYDTFWMTSKNIDNYTYDITITDNANFVLNALEYLQNINILSSVRNKSATQRPFTNLELKNRLYAQQYQLKVREIENKINETKLGIQEIWAKKDFEERENFTPDELTTISNIRKSLQNLRLELLKVKEEQYEHIKKLSNQIKFFNIYAIPLAILAIMGIILIRYKQKTPYKKITINRPLLILIISGLIIFSLGYTTNHYTMQKYSPKYLNEPLFKGLIKDINKIDQIELRGHNQNLIFYKKDGIWQLNDEPYLAVDQKRIRSFLSALIEATHFEKKSSKVAHLGKFGLLPIDNPDSAAVSVSLKDKDGTNIQQFYIGKYDIDIGRGTKAAYIRFPNKFQVWLAKIDLIDISLNKTDWTYSHAWDLRLGRFETLKNQDVNTLSYIARDLINTSFIDATKNLTNKEKISSITLDIEDEENITISLWKSQDKYYLSYTFPEKINQPDLAFFVNTATGIYYEISEDRAKTLKNVFRQ